MYIQGDYNVVPRIIECANISRRRSPKYKSESLCITTQLHEATNLKSAELLSSNIGLCPEESESCCNREMYNYKSAMLNVHSDEVRGLYATTLMINIR